MSNRLCPNPGSIWKWGLWLALCAWLCWLFRDRWQDLASGVFLPSGPFWGLVLAMVLMPLNWGLETWKFRILLGPEARLPPGRLVRSVLAGVAMSMTLPNRLGESLGRLAVFPVWLRGAALSASVTGSMLQMAWILAGGLLAVGWSGGGRPALMSLVFPAASWWWPAALLGGAILAALFIAPLREVLCSSWRHFKKSLGIARVTGAALVGLCRYGTFILQYVCLLRYAGADGEGADLLVFAALVFFIQSVLPLPPAVGWVGRLQLAVLMSGWAGIQPGQAVLASLLLWTLNLFLPALPGTAFVMKNYPETALSDVEILPDRA